MNRFRGNARSERGAELIEFALVCPLLLLLILGIVDFGFLFQRMAVEVAARERRLEAQVHQLTIAIDERKKAAQVQEITESDYFRELKARAHQFSGRRAARSRGHS